MDLFEGLFATGSKTFQSLYERRQKLLEEENVRTAVENEELRNELMKLEAEMLVFLYISNASFAR